MNPTLLSCTLFLVFIITIGTEAASGDVVYDVTGEKVLDNVPYYIGPVVWANGGGIKLTDTKNDTKVCPFYLVQDPAEVNVGGQFSFIQTAKQEYLLTSYILSIDSGNPKSSCDQPTYWQIPDAEAKAPSNLITTGGLFDTSKTCFQVVDYPKPTSPKVHSYMLQHCPWSCGAGPHTCFNVSIYEEEGVRYLASSGSTPFEFVFQKVQV